MIFVLSCKFVALVCVHCVVSIIAENDNKRVEMAHTSTLMNLLEADK